MIGREQIEEIMAQYAKHGWKLRRVLLSGDPGKAADVADIFGDVEITPSELDAAWFTRSSRPGITAWELRHLSPAPYSLVENITDGTEEFEAEESLKRVETRMIQAISSRTPEGSH